MKPVVAFFLGLLMLVSGLVPRNDFAELTKLPELARHYRYHRALAGGRLSPLAFLALHYGPQGARHHRNPVSSRDAQDHQKLPLEHQHHNCVPVSFVVPNPALTVTRPRPVAWPARAYRPAPGSLYAFRGSRTLLQPPRA
ncbi:hypothetical protein KLP40_19100 [Hymenobacter sp. NST-14]|uniref:hypothetical protein n=1 Tax=Hymenobacter piscis TaxID=2839984 RepID=UPI001C00BA51|nr:hypothetical protein [Hymenobacter piscis]MBT9395282.1 hypothetical protein [Hymenobacter piscis]